eukprot:jgi/Chrzof1/6300/Cz18g00210.t1
MSGFSNLADDFHSYPDSANSFCAPAGFKLADDLLITRQHHASQLIDALDLAQVGRGFSQRLPVVPLHEQHLSAPESQQALPLDQASTALPAAVSQANSTMAATESGQSGGLTCIIRNTSDSSSDPKGADKQLRHEHDDDVYEDAGTDPVFNAANGTVDSLRNTYEDAVSDPVPNAAVPPDNLVVGGGASFQRDADAHGNHDSATAPAVMNLPAAGTPAAGLQPNGKYSQATGASPDVLQQWKHRAKPTTADQRNTDQRHTDQRLMANQHHHHHQHHKHGLWFALKQSLSRVSCRSARTHEDDEDDNDIVGCSQHQLHTAAPLAANYSSNSPSQKRVVVPAHAPAKPSCSQHAKKGSNPAVNKPPWETQGTELIYK